MEGGNARQEQAERRIPVSWNEIEAFERYALHKLESSEWLDEWEALYKKDGFLLESNILTNPNFFTFFVRRL